MGRAMTKNPLYLLLIAVILITAWGYIYTSNSQPESANKIFQKNNSLDNNEALAGLIQVMTTSIDNLSHNMEKMSSTQENILIALKSNRLGTASEIIEHPGQSAMPEINIPHSSLEAVMAQAVEEPGRFDERHPPVIVVNPTEEETRHYSMFNTLLDDPSYLASLNLVNFTQQNDFASLPRELRMVLVNKAVKLYNEGMIDKDTFFGSAQ